MAMPGGKPAPGATFRVAGVRAAQPALPEPAPLRHIGIYAYRAGFLQTFAALPAGGLEGIESLEQLRVLWNGYPIAVHVTDSAPEAGVDTPEDLARVRRHYDGDCAAS